jgi:arginine deiminase
MHLDTVFTFIDHGLCLAHAPLLSPSGMEQVRVYECDLTKERLTFTVAASFRRALADVGLEIDLVPCGGDDPIDQEREQWTDGANAFAIEPGVILLYERNHRTIEALERRGFREVTHRDVIDHGVEVLGHGRTVVTFAGHELSRARGGPRCMTMPLERDPIG